MTEYKSLEELTKNLTPEQKEQLEEDAPYIIKFEGEYGAVIVDIQENNEHHPPKGLMYYFDDNLGGYSIEGIKESLEEE